MAEDTGEGPRDPSRREFLQKLVKRAAVVAGTSKLGYEGLKKAGAIESRHHKPTLRVDFNEFLETERPELVYGMERGVDVEVDGYLKLVSAETDGSERVYRYALYPNVVDDKDVPETTQELGEAAGSGRLIGVAVKKTPSTHPDGVRGLDAEMKYQTGRWTRVIGRPQSKGYITLDTATLGYGHGVDNPKHKLKPISAPAGK